MNKLNEVVQEIVVATGYPAADIIDGVKILPPSERGGEIRAGIITFTRKDLEEDGTWSVWTLESLEHDRPAYVSRRDLPEGLWEKLEQSCLADDPSLKGRKLVGGVELRNFHAYFLPEGEDQQWISTDTFSF